MIDYVVIALSSFCKDDVTFSFVTSSDRPLSFAMSKRAVIFWLSCSWEACIRRLHFKQLSVIINPSKLLLLQGF